MKETHIKFLFCPQCKSSLTLHDAKEQNNSIESGSLTCSICKSQYPVVRHIPRFVPLQNYANSFGFQWIKHARTQYDSYSGSNVSEKRFFEETKWPRDLRQQLILEAGSGSGRFTEQAASTGAMVLSIDYSQAVEANYDSNGDKDNVLIVQADIYNMPFRENYFDKLFCFGVLQHTPDVKKAFMTLPPYLKTGGRLVIDVYKKQCLLKQLLRTKYYARIFTRRITPEKLYNFTNKYINLMWPLARLINKLPLGRNINQSLLIADYRGLYDLDEDTLKEWAILDTFDMLSPTYDNPQTIETVKQWFDDALLTDVDVCYGYNGIEARATKP